jgi:hypothetical protein
MNKLFIVKCLVISLVWLHGVVLVKTSVRIEVNAMSEIMCGGILENETEVLELIF